MLHKGDDQRLSAMQGSDLVRFVARLAEEMPDLDQRVIDALAEEHPATFALLDDDLVRRAIETADRNFLTGLQGDLESAGQATAPVAAKLGAQASRAGAPLDHLADGVRTYQRLSWDVAARLAAELDLQGDVMTRVAETYIKFADDFTRATVDGYIEVASQREVARLLARQQLLLALLTPPANLADLAARAAACDWNFPTGPVRIALARGDETSWPSNALVGEYAGQQVALLVDEPGEGLAVACGPAVELDEVRSSWEIACRLNDLAPADATGPVLWEDHLAMLAVTADCRTASALCERVLAPLDHASQRQRPWLEPTLRAWLDTQGSSRRLAEVLHLHEQSARYRVQRMREAFGGILDDPQGRFELRLALQIRASGIRSSS